MPRGTRKLKWEGATDLHALIQEEVIDNHNEEHIAELLPYFPEMLNSKVANIIGFTLNGIADGFLSMNVPIHTKPIQTAISILNTAYTRLHMKELEERADRYEELHNEAEEKLSKGEEGYDLLNEELETAREKIKQLEEQVHNIEEVEPHKEVAKSLFLIDPVDHTAEEFTNFASMEGVTIDKEDAERIVKTIIGILQPFENDMAHIEPIDFVRLTVKAAHEEIVIHYEDCIPGVEENHFAATAILLAMMPDSYGIDLQAWHKNMKLHYNS